MVNESYYGEKTTWSTAHAKSENQDFAVKIPAFNLSNTTECYSGSLAYKWGAFYDENESYIVENDESFCFCAMDENAPQLKSIFSTVTIPSGDNAGHFYAKMTVSPEKPVPFGWAMGTVRDYVTVIGTGDYWHRAPVNFSPVWYNPDWHPTKNTYAGKTLLSYLSESAGDLYTFSPVLSFPYKNVKLVPVIRAYALASGKTENDVKNAVTLSDFTSAVNRSSFCTVDLKTYLNDSYDGTPFYEKFPVISSIYVVPVLLYFDNNGDLVPPTGSSKKYHSTAENTGSWATLKSAFYPMYFNEKTAFDEIFQYDGTAFASQDEKTCETMFFNPSKCPFSYIYYGYNGTTTPTGFLSVDTNGWGAFCVAGRAVESGNLRTDMYCRTIADFRTFWNASGECDCGSLISDYTDVYGFREFVRKIIAYFGMYFSDGVVNDIEEKSTMDTTGLHLGIVDENGITHGQYTTGDQNPTAPNYDWVDPVEDTPYTPGGGGDDELPSDPLTLNINAVSGFGVAANYYALRYTDVDDLTNYINYYMSYENAENAAIAAGNPYEQWFADKFKTPADWYSYVFSMAGFGVHPNNDIISLMAFPFELSGTDTGYKLGSWETNVYHNNFGLLPDTPLLTGKQITGDGFKIVNLGSGVVTYPGVHGDFRDYAPYTRLELQIPYHGTAQLDTGEWLGKNITIQAIVDLMTGASLAIVCRDNAPVMTIPGQMGISVPLSVDNVSQTSNTFNALSTQAQSTFINTVASIFTGVARSAGAVAGAVGSGITGNLPGVVSGAFGALGSEWGMVGDFLKNRLAIKQNTFDMEHTVNGKLVSGGGVPNVNAKYETKCRLVWHYPQTIPGSNPNDFPGVVGHSCNVTGIVNDFSGYLECSAVDTAGIPCTETEKTMIVTALKSGVFV